MHTTSSVLSRISWTSTETSPTVIAKFASVPTMPVAAESLLSALNEHSFVHEKIGIDTDAHQIQLEALCTSWPIFWSCLVWLPIQKCDSNWLRTPGAPPTLTGLTCLRCCRKRKLTLWNNHVMKGLSSAHRTTTGLSTATYVVSLSAAQRSLLYGPAAALAPPAAVAACAWASSLALSPGVARQLLRLGRTC